VRFTLDARLAADTLVVGDGPLSRILLMNDARYPWVILVPRRPGLVEITDLAAEERVELMEEMADFAKALGALPGIEKINMGALGNIVRQLHVHIVGRRLGDTAWPGPVWGAGAAMAYDATAGEALRACLAETLGVVRSEPNG
jgi:diadenosine tetraphosphate (Ap4A) HIT family hydrolase